MWGVLLLALVGGQGQDWSAAIQPALQAIVRVEVLTADGEGTCSGVVLDRDRGFVLTAGHCVRHDPQTALSVTVAHAHADVVRANDLLDLAVLHTDGKLPAAFPLAAKTPPAGSPVAVIGYAFGTTKLTAQFGHVALPLDEGDNLELDVMVIPGDSGGAAIDADGALIGIVQAGRSAAGGIAHLGLMAPVETIRAFVKPYLPKVP